MSQAIEVIHGEGFMRVFVSDRYAVDAADRALVEREGREIVERGFVKLEGLLAGPTYVGDRFSVADAAVFYVEFWADRTGVAMPARCQAHYRAMLGRPAVRQVLAEEGYASTLRKHTVPTTLGR
jgi:glutathione S-transferase